MKTNSAELFIKNRATLNSFGESIANGPTLESVNLAEENVTRAHALLSQVEQEYAEKILADMRRDEARAKTATE